MQLTFDACSQKAPQKIHSKNKLKAHERYIAELQKERIITITNRRRSIKKKLPAHENGEKSDDDDDDDDEHDAEKDEEDEAQQKRV